MPTSPSAKKSLRQAGRRRHINFQKKKALKTTKRALLGSPSQETLSAAYKAIDKAAKSGYLKKSSASRKKSRLTKAHNKQTASRS